MGKLEKIELENAKVSKLRADYIDLDSKEHSDFVFELFLLGFDCFKFTWYWEALQITNKATLKMDTLLNQESAWMRFDKAAKENKLSECRRMTNDRLEQVKDIRKSYRQVVDLLKKFSQEFKLSSESKKIIKKTTEQFDKVDSIFGAFVDAHTGSIVFG